MDKKSPLEIWIEQEIKYAELTKKLALVGIVSKPVVVYEAKQAANENRNYLLNN